MADILALELHDRQSFDAVLRPRPEAVPRPSIGIASRVLVVEVIEDIGFALARRPVHAIAKREIVHDRVVFRRQSFLPFLALLESDQDAIAAVADDGVAPQRIAVPLDPDSRFVVGGAVAAGTIADQGVVQSVILNPKAVVVIADRDVVDQSVIAAVPDFEAFAGIAFGKIADEHVGGIGIVITIDPEAMIGVSRRQITYQPIVAAFDSKAFAGEAVRPIVDEKVMVAPHPETAVSDLILGRSYDQPPKRVVTVAADINAVLAVLDDPV